MSVFIKSGALEMIEEEIREDDGDVEKIMKLEVKNERMCKMKLKLRKMEDSEEQREMRNLISMKKEKKHFLALLKDYEKTIVNSNIKSDLSVIMS